MAHDEKGLGGANDILIVDDDVDGREATARYLESAGYDVRSVANGKEALSAVLERLPSLVILDVFMPEMDGAGLLEILRSYLRLQSLPVVVLTGLPDSPLVERIRFLKVNAILIKGRATLDDILQTVKEEIHRMPT